MFECCTLLGDSILPSSKISPCTNQELNLVMKDIGMEYEAIDECLKTISYVMQNMWQSWNSLNVELVDIEQ